ncbi:hypothetical protein CSV75_12625 [Sporosarcina sp. P18a]|nr:hypothetical protein CSV75_12625 [Sporosarcina sp. P18a]
MTHCVIPESGAIVAQVIATISQSDQIVRKGESKLDNNKHPKNLIIVRLVATTFILLSLILPYFGLMEHSTTPIVIFIILFVFYVMENKYCEKTASE